MTIEVGIYHKFSFGNEEVAMYKANKGEGLPKHEHTYGHTTLCKEGSCIIRTAKKNFTIDKNSNQIYLEPFEWHEIEALEDNTVIINTHKK